jgi:ribosomal protein S1
MFKIGDKVKVQVISVEDNKFSLSIKRLLPDPWLKKSKEYKVDSIVEGEIERITPFGAFVRLKNNVMV